MSPETPAERRLRELVSYDYGDDDGTLSRAADMGREALALLRRQTISAEWAEQRRALLARAGEE